MDRPDRTVNEIGELASRLAVWSPGTLSDRAEDLAKIRDFLALIEREVLAQSAATASPSAPENLS